MLHKPSRRRIARTAIIGILLGCTPVIAQQGADKTLRIVVPFGPGGGSDIFARMLQPKLAEALKVTVVIENRPGAGGTLGAELVAKSPPDGSVLLLSDSGVATISPSLYPKLPYGAKDLVPVINLAQFANVLVAPIRLPANNLADVIAMERANPGRLSIASSGNGTSPHLTAEMLKLATGMKLVHVPYKGSGPAISDTAGGQVDMVFTGYASVSGLLKSGKLKALAVSSPRRLAELPQAPTVAETGYPGFESWIAQAVFAPAGTPREIVARYNAAIAAILRQPEVLDRLKVQGLEPFDNTPEQFTAWVARQGEQWGKVIREAGVKPE